jgi:hypothetical protein
MLEHDTIIAGRMRVVAGLVCLISIFVGVGAALFRSPPPQTSDSMDGV